MIVNPVGFFGEERAFVPLGDLVASCVFDLDATISDSYAGSGQIWANFEPTPADSSAQSAYDFYLGSGSGGDSADPTFNGTAGDAAAYFSFDGSDRFTLAGSLTSFLQDLAKTSQDSWVAVAASIPNDAGGEQILFQTTSDTVNSRNGIELRKASNSTGNFARVIRSTSSGLESDYHDIAIPDASPAVIIISYNGSAGTFRNWINNNRATDASVSTGGTVNNATNCCLGSRPNGNLAVVNGTRYYSVAAGNSFIGDAEADAIYQQYKQRHQRSYS